MLWFVETDSDGLFCPSRRRSGGNEQLKLPHMGEDGVIWGQQPVPCSLYFISFSSAPGPVYVYVYQI